MGLGFNSTLPDGLLPADVAGMQHFLSKLITPHVPKSTFIQVSRASWLETRLSTELEVC